MCSDSSKPRLVVIGASGFIGTALCQHLQNDFDLIALTRSPHRARLTLPGVTWQHCDLLSRREVEHALSGSERLVYLVHSMLPGARLTQARPEDVDLLIADNVARGAARQGVRQIVHLGSLLPEQADLPPLWRSRREVEQVLGGHGAALAVLRAGLVLGPGSTTVRLLTRLLDGAVVPLPNWAQGQQQPVALSDVVAGLAALVTEPIQNTRRAIGGPEVLDHAALLAMIATALGRYPRWWRSNVPLWAYRAWLRYQDREAYPALLQQWSEGLAFDQLVAGNGEAVIGQIGVATALASCVDDRGQLLANPRRTIQQQDRTTLQTARRVYSIQRLPLPPGRDAEWLAEHYFAWLPRAVWPWVRSHRSAEGVWEIGSRFPPLTLLALRHRPSHSSPDRQMFFITGGWLARTGGERPGRFEFRQVLNGRYLIAAIYDYSPQLPWLLYSFTQALAHGLVMGGYRRVMAKLIREKPSID